MKKKLIAGALSLSMCLIPFSQSILATTENVTKEKKELNIISSKLGTFSNNFLEIKFKSDDDLNLIKSINVKSIKYSEVDNENLLKDNTFFKKTKTQDCLLKIHSNTEFKKGDKISITTKNATITYVIKTTELDLLNANNQNILELDNTSSINLNNSEVSNIDNKGNDEQIEKQNDFSLTFEKGTFGSSDKYKFTSKDKTDKINEIYVNNTLYSSKDNKLSVFGNSYFIDNVNNELYLGNNLSEGDFIKFVFKDGSFILFKNNNNTLIKVEENNKTNSKKVEENNDDENLNEKNELSFVYIKGNFPSNDRYQFTPKDKIKNVKEIYVENTLYSSKDSKSSVFGNSYFIDNVNNELYLGNFSNGNIIKFIFNDGSVALFENNNNNFKKIDNNISKKYHLRIVGTFEPAIVNQQKYDAISSATSGGVNANKNSDVKLQIAYTEKEKPNENDFKDVKDVTNNLKFEAQIVNSDSGMIAKYNSLDGSITLSGTPSKEGTFKIFVQTKDKKLKSNELEFKIFDKENTPLESQLITSEFKSLKFPKDKKQWDMTPWKIQKFTKNNKETVEVPKDLKLWFGSRTSGSYGELGYPIDKDPTQTLIVTGELYLINMKILSSVNIVVKDGGKLNLSDSSLYGKITVENNGTLELNYDSYHKSFSSGSSINGQIILKDGATLQNASIYSNANYLTDSNKARQIQTPVVSVQGNATIKGNVFIRGDEAPTGEKFKGQGAMEILKGAKLTIEKDAKLGLFGGGRFALTSNGANALELFGTIDGEGTLIAIGGNGRFSGKGASAVSGNGQISVSNVYLRGGNSYMSTKDGAKAVSENITFDKNTKGLEINGKKTTNTIEDAMVENETPIWNSHSAPDNKLLEKFDTSNADTIIQNRQEKELENLKNELETLKKDFDEVKKSDKEKQNIINELNNKIQILEEKIKELKTHNQQLNEKIENLNSKVDNLQGDLNNTKKELEKLKNKNDNNKTSDDNIKKSDNNNKKSDDNIKKSDDKDTKTSNKSEIRFLENKKDITKNTKDKLSFRLDDKVENFKNVLVDKKLIDPQMYTVKSGSTIIEFKDEFINSLSKGNHEFDFEFKDGIAKTTVEVNENTNQPVKITDDKINNQPVTKTDDKTNNQPVIKTDDKTSNQPVIKTDDKTSNQPVTKIDDKTNNQPVKITDDEINNQPIEKVDSNSTEKKSTKQQILPQTNIAQSSILLALTSLVGFVYSKKKNK